MARAFRLPEDHVRWSRPTPAVASAKKMHVLLRGRRWRAGAGGWPPREVDRDAAREPAAASRPGRRRSRRPPTTTACSSVSRASSRQRRLPSIHSPRPEPPGTATILPAYRPPPTRGKAGRRHQQAAPQPIAAGMTMGALVMERTDLRRSPRPRSGRDPAPQPDSEGRSSLHLRVGIRLRQRRLSSGRAMALELADYEGLARATRPVERPAPRRGCVLLHRVHGVGIVDVPTARHGRGAGTRDRASVTRRRRHRALPPLVLVARAGTCHHGGPDRGRRAWYRAGACRGLSARHRRDARGQRNLREPRRHRPARHGRSGGGDAPDEDPRRGGRASRSERGRPRDPRGPRLRARDARPGRHALRRGGGGGAGAPRGDRAPCSARSHPPRPRPRGPGGGGRDMAG